MRRQFVLASMPLGLNELCSHRLGKWWLYAGADARIQLGRRIGLVGLAADLETAEPVGLVDLEMSYDAGGLRALVDYTDQLVGRFLILVEEDGRLSVIPDGWASLQAFWGQASDGTRALGSSPGLLRELGFGSTANCDESRLLDERAAKALEYRSVGDLCPVSGTKRIQANHVLELSAGLQQRLPLRHRDTSFETITVELGRAMRGLQSAHGGESWLPITAGLDSRWLAWAASNANANVRLFTFTPDAYPTPDATVGAEIADRLGAEHTRIALSDSVSTSVRDDVTAVRGEWRDLPKMAEIEFHSSSSPRVLVFNGNGGEIVRGGYYGAGLRPTNRRLVRSLCLGSRSSAFDIDGFNRWYASLASLPEKRTVDLDELFYWEQRMANWGSDFYAEKENYVDELSPFCSRRILRSGPALAGQKRRIQVAEALASVELFTNVPVNPHESHGGLKRLAYVKSLGNLVRDGIPGGAHPRTDTGTRTESQQGVEAEPPLPIGHSSLGTSASLFKPSNRFQFWNRARKLDQFERLGTNARGSILDVGFMATEQRGTENTLERSIDDLSRVTALTVADSGGAEERYPGLRIVQYDGGRFPFDDREFEACWSDAALEYVGDEADRRFFLAEADRVATRSLLTTPNRWFPIESHTRIPFLHYLPRQLFDWILRRLGKEWATGRHMHLMGRREIVRLLHEAGVEDFQVLSNRMGPLTVDFSILIRPLTSADRLEPQRQREAGRAS